MRILTNISRREAVARYPQAVAVVRVSGGYAVFFTHHAYTTWKGQR